MTKATRKSHSTTHISSRIFFTIFREFLRFFYASWRLGTKVHPWTTILGKGGYKSTPGTPILVDFGQPLGPEIGQNPYPTLWGIIRGPVALVVLLVLAAVEVEVEVVVLPLVQAPAGLLGFFGSLVQRSKRAVALAVVLVGGTLNRLPMELLMLLVGSQGELTLW